MKKALFVLSLVTFFALAAAAPSCSVSPASGMPESYVRITISYSELASDFSAASVNCGTGTQVTIAASECTGTRAGTCATNCYYKTTGTYTVTANIATVTSASLVTAPTALSCSSGTITVSTTGAANPTPTATSVPIQQPTTTGTKEPLAQTITAAPQLYSPFTLTVRPVVGISTLEAAGITSINCLQHLQRNNFNEPFQVDAANRIVLTNAARENCAGAEIVTAVQKVRISAGEVVLFKNGVVTSHLFETEFEKMPEQPTKEQTQITDACLARCRDTAFAINANLQVEISRECIANCEGAGIPILASAVPMELLIAQAAVSPTFSNTLHTVVSGGKTVIVAPTTLELAKGSLAVISPASTSFELSGVTITTSQSTAPTLSTEATLYSAQGGAEKTTLTLSTSPTDAVVTISELGTPTAITTADQVAVAPSGNVILTDVATGASDLLTMSPSTITAATTDATGMTTVTSITADATVDANGQPTTTITVEGTKEGSLLGIIPTSVPVTYTIVESNPVTVPTPAPTLTASTPAYTASIATATPEVVAATPMAMVATPVPTLEAQTPPLTATLVTPTPVPSVAPLIATSTTTTEPLWSALVLT
ncbi:MAG: hypothetical protein AB1626_04570 [Candidatus Micrarchaeota archaeon]